MDGWPELITGIADSDGSRCYRPFPRKVGIITDEFMYNYYADALDLVFLSPGDYRELIDEGDLAFVLYVTCWYGLEPARAYRTGAMPPTAEGEARGCKTRHVEDVQNVLDYARGKGITTVYQSIEDPTNYHLFIDIARHADVIFTSAEEKVDDYRADTGNEAVYCLRYGINPRLHNPIGMFDETRQDERFDCFRKSVFFAGSWYEGFAERRAAMEMLFDGVVSAGKNLVIADRNLFKEDADRDTLVYPARFNPYIMPAIEHVALQKVHKLFDFTLNVNTVVDSKTMCAMRAYEVPALGGLVISNDTPAMHGLSPAVFPVSNALQVADVLDMTASEVVSRKLDGVRDMYAHATVYQRLNEIFALIGVDYRFEEPMLLALCDEATDALRAQVGRQTCGNVELVERSRWEGALSGAGQGSFATYVSPGSACWSSPHYFEDALNAFKFADVDYVRASVAGQPYRFCDDSADLHDDGVVFDPCASSWSHGFSVPR